MTVEMEVMNLDVDHVLLLTSAARMVVASHQVTFATMQMIVKTIVMKLVVVLVVSLSLDVTMATVSVQT